MTDNSTDYALAAAAIRRTAAGFRASMDVPPHGLTRAALNLEQAADLIFRFGGAGSAADGQRYRNHARELRELAADTMCAPLLGFIAHTASLLDSAADRLEQALRQEPAA